MDANINLMVQELVQAGFTQGWIARIINVSQPTISNIYRGKQKEMMGKRIKRLEVLYANMKENKAFPK